MTSDVKNAVMHLIQMCTYGLTFLAHGNNLLNQTRWNYIISVLPRHMSELGKKVPEDSDWLFGDNIVSRINQIKARQQALTSMALRTQKIAGILQKPRESTKRVLPEPAKKRTEQKQLL